MLEMYKEHSARIHFVYDVNSSSPKDVKSGSKWMKVKRAWNEKWSNREKNVVENEREIEWMRSEEERFFPSTIQFNKSYILHKHIQNGCNIMKWLLSVSFAYAEESDAHSRWIKSKWWWLWWWWEIGGDRVTRSRRGMPSTHLSLFRPFHIVFVHIFHSDQTVILRKVYQKWKPWAVFLSHFTPEIRWVL